MLLRDRITGLRTLKGSTMNDASPGTTCHIFYNQYVCDGTTYNWSIVDKTIESHFITEVLVPLGFSFLLFAGAAAIMLGAMVWLAEKLAKPARR